MTEPIDLRRGRQPALDGLRAIAVSLVLAYHGGLPGLARGGFFGVDVFFVLSGYLITTLLLSEQDRAGRIDLAGFWARRARRLLPGLLLMLAAVVVYVECFAAPGSYTGIRGDVLAVVAYVSNWHLIASSSDYFAAAGTPSLLTHTWSLAIEEQFYVLWPLLLWALRVWARRTDRRPETVVAWLSGSGAVVSAVWMAYLYRAGGNLSRLYYGTDTHAQGLLVGATLAAVLAGGAGRLDRAARPAAAVAGGAVLLVAACRLGYSDGLTYSGGFLLVSVATATVLLVAVRRPGSAPARVLSTGPFRYIGRISYGMYLWYFPLFAVLDHARTGLTGATLFTVRAGADVALAAVSFHLVEQPLGARLARWPTRSRAALTSLSIGGGALAATALAVVVATPAAPVTAAPPHGAFTTSLAGAPTLLVIGDSTGGTLGLALAQAPAERTLGYSVDVRTIQGCGLQVSAQLIEDGVVARPPSACLTGAPADGRWSAQLAAELITDHPQVVLLAAGRWEVRTRQATPGGQWVDITQPADAADVRAQMERAVALVAAAHVKLVIATAPCYSSGETASGGTWPEDSPARVDAYNSIVRQVAAGHPGLVKVLDLNAMMCPRGEFTETVDGVTVRSPDGVHYPFFAFSDPQAAAPDTLATVQAFGDWLAPKVRAALTSG